MSIAEVVRDYFPNNEFSSRLDFAWQLTLARVKNETERFDEFRREAFAFGHDKGVSDEDVHYYTTGRLPPTCWYITLPENIIYAVMHLHYHRQRRGFVLKR